MGLTPERYAKFVELPYEKILEELSRVSAGSTAGQEELNFLNQLLAARTARILADGLLETARVAGVSANTVKDSLDRSAATMKATLENSSEWLINAIKVGTEAGSKSATEIRSQIANLTLHLAEASRDLQAASDQSSRLSRRLNLLTAALVFAGLITAGATGYQAWETKRQADLLEMQNRSRVASQDLSPDRPAATGTQQPKK